MKTFAAAMLLSLAFAGSVSAQYPPAVAGGYPGYRPRTSPYLNLMGSRNPAVNYYGLVRPQQDFQNAMLGGNVSPAPVNAEEMTDPQLRRPTGHAVAFNNLLHYYYNNPAVPNRGGFGGALATQGVGAAQFNSVAPALGANGAWTTVPQNRGRSYGAYGFSSGYGGIR
jgi:hypothetical protein